MPNTPVFLVSIAATGTLLVVLGFSVYLVLVAVRTHGSARRDARTRPH